MDQIFPNPRYGGLAIMTGRLMGRGGGLRSVRYISKYARRFDSHHGGGTSFIRLVVMSMGE